MSVLMLSAPFSWSDVVISNTAANTATNTAETPTIVKHYQSQERYRFGHQLLTLALSKIDQPFTVQPFTRHKINEGRGEVSLINGEFDVQWLSTSAYREQQLTAIKIPIYRGLIGLRLLLVKKENKDRISRIQTLQQLQQLTGGHGTHWADLPIYKANNLPVVSNANYEPLFLQLAADRFDYFHRGVNEIWDEYARHSKTLDIADNVMLFYPHPVYFFVNKDKPELADHLERGLKIALEDGSYKALFYNYHGESIRQAKLYKRKLIRLSNPTLPKNTPTIDTHWWLPTTLH
jgi:hypothetical protein